jgi:hypothetical protein
MAQLLETHCGTNKWLIARYSYRSEMKIFEEEKNVTGEGVTFIEDNLAAKRKREQGAFVAG